MTKEQSLLLGNFNRLSNSIFVKEKLISVRSNNEFAILERQTNQDGLTCITFSIPLTANDVDIINQSGIAQVTQYSSSGTLVFTRKSFYDSHKMIDLITDILIKYETKTEALQHLA